MRLVLEVSVSPQGPAQPVHVLKGIYTRPSASYPNQREAGIHKAIVFSHS